MDVLNIIQYNSRKHSGLFRSRQLKLKLVNESESVFVLSI